MSKWIRFDKEQEQDTGYPGGWECAVCKNVYIGPWAEQESIDCEKRDKERAEKWEVPTIPTKTDSKNSL